MREYTNSQIAAIIDEHIHSERDRALLKRRLIDELMSVLQATNPRLYAGVMRKIEQ